MNTEQLIEIARECGAVIDVLCMGRHDNVVFTSGEIQRFVQRIEQPYIDTIEDLHDEIGRLREALRSIKAHDQKCMYNACPDCDWPEECKLHGACKGMPHSRVGEIACKALEQTK